MTPLLLIIYYFYGERILGNNLQNRSHVMQGLHFNDTDKNELRLKILSLDPTSKFNWNPLRIFVYETTPDYNIILCKR
jgi:hypothetical protein